MAYHYFPRSRSAPMTSLPSSLFMVFFGQCRSLETIKPSCDPSCLLPSPVSFLFARACQRLILQGKSRHAR